jgi:hypothetical protein
MTSRAPSTPIGGEEDRQIDPGIAEGYKLLAAT